MSSYYEGKMGCRWDADEKERIEKPGICYISPGKPKHPPFQYTYPITYPVPKTVEYTPMPLSPENSLLDLVK